MVFTEDEAFKNKQPMESNLISLNTLENAVFKNSVQIKDMSYFDRDLSGSYTINKIMDAFKGEYQLSDKVTRLTDATLRMGVIFGEKEDNTEMEYDYILSELKVDLMPAEGTDFVSNPSETQ